MCWRLEAPHGDPTQGDAFLSAMVAAKPKVSLFKLRLIYLNYPTNLALPCLPLQAVWLSFGQELRNWVRRYREKEAHEGLSTTVIFVNASTVKQALDAKEWEGVDVVVAQGGGLSSATERCTTG